MLISLRKCRRADLYAGPREVSADEAAILAQMTQRRENGEPLQYILGECDFMGLEFHVDSRVHIPNPETEVLVDNVLALFTGDRNQPLEIFEVGTGSGNIAVALAKTLPNSRVVSMDVSPEALEVAQGNARGHGVQDRIGFLCGDFLDWIRRPLLTAGRFDILVANPPYVPTGDIPGLMPEVRAEPPLALDGGNDGLKFFEPIIFAGGKLLKPGGWLYLEIGDGQRNAIEQMLPKYPQFHPVSFLTDLAGKDRILKARYTPGAL